MIQRIQTLFLGLALILSLAMFFMPLVSFLSDLSYMKLYLYDLKNFTPDSDLQFGFMAVAPLIIINSAIVLILAWTISQYKNRIQQMKLIRFAMLLSMFLIAGIFFLYPNLVSKNTQAVSEFEAGAYIPIINLLLLFIANRYIMRDERLVRSIDRLR